jgi:hypothetical protein
MSHISNISITPEALPMLQRMRASVPVRPGELFALVYMSSFSNSRGVAVPGFVPGYVAYPDPLRKLSERWVAAHLPDGVEFCFVPKYRLNADQHYLIDVASPRFSTLSIEPRRSN